MHYEEMDLFLTSTTKHSLFKILNFHIEGNTLGGNSTLLHICYLPAGRSVWRKTVTEVLKQHFQGRGHSFFTIRIDP